jgi:hypothetical protein
MKMVENMLVFVPYSEAASNIEKNSSLEQRWGFR